MTTRLSQIKQKEHNVRNLLFFIIGNKLTIKKEIVANKPLPLFPNINFCVQLYSYYKKTWDIILSKSFFLFEKLYGTKFVQLHHNVNIKFFLIVMNLSLLRNHN